MKKYWRMLWGFVEQIMTSFNTNTRHVSWNLLVIIFALFALLASQVGLSQYQIIRVFGQVTDSEGVGICRTKVSFICEGLGDTSSTSTDTLGVYSIKLSFAGTGIYENSSSTLQRCQLNQNYPNPFNPGTTITFELPHPSHINLSIFNINGQLVRKLADCHYSTGISRVIWDGTDDAGRGVSAGIYIYRIESEGLTQSRKMLLSDGAKGTIKSCKGGPGLNLLLKPQHDIPQKTYNISVEKQGFNPFVGKISTAFTDSVVEKNIALKRLDYFPLAIGNSWTFGYRIANQGQEQEVTFTITGKKTINDHECYQFNIWPWFLPVFSDTALMRKTQQWDTVLRMANQELLIYDFFNAIMDSLREIHVDSLPGYPEDVDLIVRLTSMNDTVVTPAGTFENCYRFLSGIKQGIDSNSWIWFAPGIGPVRFQSTNVEIDYRLKSVCINGKGRYYRSLNIIR